MTEFGKTAAFLQLSATRQPNRRLNCHDPRRYGRRSDPSKRSSLIFQTGSECINGRDDRRREGILVDLGLQESALGFVVGHADVLEPGARAPSFPGFQR